MHKYFIKTPWLVKRLFSSYVWSLPNEEPDVYLSFDDGPHPTITPWVLDQLKAFEAKASFFCIGNNVEQYPDVYARILEEGHVTGNHTHHHLNGWKTDEETYLNDVAQAAKKVNSHLFRPPYGKIKSSQAKGVRRMLGAKTSIVMWDVLSGDFDTTFSPQRCLANVVDHVSEGSIVVFHDSEKAFRNLEYALPRTLEYLRNAGYIPKKINL